jgi:hypothetical protein
MSSSLVAAMLGLTPAPSMRCSTRLNSSGRSSIGRGFWSAALRKSLTGGNSLPPINYSSCPHDPARPHMENTCNDSWMSPALLWFAMRHHDAPSPTGRIRGPSKNHPGGRRARPRGQLFPKRRGSSEPSSRCLCRVASIKNKVCTTCRQTA